MKDISESVSITGSIYAQWCDLCRTKGVLLAYRLGIPASKIPDEIIVEHPELPGYLQIRVELGKHIVTLDVPPSQWAWSDNRN